MSDIKSIDWLERLQKDGYCIIPDLLPQSSIAALDADLERDFTCLLYTSPSPRDRG